MFSTSAQIIKVRIRGRRRARIQIQKYSKIHLTTNVELGSRFELQHWLKRLLCMHCQISFFVRKVLSGYGCRVRQIMIIFLIC
jgi:hypothetical protein